MGTAHHNFKQLAEPTEIDLKRIEYYVNNSDELSTEQIARKFGVSLGFVYAIKRRKREESEAQES